MNFLLKIFRGYPGKQHWEEFNLPLRPFENVISALMEIQKNPINSQGKQVEPIAYESGCLEEVCGSCSMLINGKPRQACTALIEELIKQHGRIITLAPFSKFPLIRDLLIDRSRMFTALQKVHAWVQLDKAVDRGPGPKIPPAQQEVMYKLSTCMTCGCCLEGCPEYGDRSYYLGVAAMSQARLFNIHPVAKEDSKERFQALMGRGGIGNCGNSQNCVRVCPKKIPLTESVNAVGKETTLQALKRFFSAPER